MTGTWILFIMVSLVLYAILLRLSWLLYQITQTMGKWLSLTDDTVRELDWEVRVLRQHVDSLISKAKDEEHP